MLRTLKRGLLVIRADYYLTETLEKRNISRCSKVKLSLFLNYLNAGVSNIVRPWATEREYSGGEGHIVNFIQLELVGHSMSNFQNILFQIPMTYNKVKSQL